MWNAVYTITYNRNGGNITVSVPESYTYGTPVTLPVPVKNGYEFGGWLCLGSIYAGITATDSGDKSFTAQWMPKKYTIDYDASGGSSAPSRQIKNHDAGVFLSSTVPVRFGYLFSGWSPHPNPTVVEYNPGDYYTTNASITLYAIWGTATFTITYTLNGGTNSVNAPISYIYGMSFTLPTPEKTGFNFEGWYLNPNFEGNAVTNILSTDSGHKDFHAKWTPMPNSPYVVHTHLSPHKNSPRNNKIQKITIHHVAGTGSIEMLGNIFANPTRNGSSNYGIGNDGRVGLYVEEKDRAWTSSSGANDHQAITIEVVNSRLGDPNNWIAEDWPVSDAALEACINLCVDICKRNNISQLNYTGDETGNLTRHNMFAATGCPGPYLQARFPYIAAQVNARL